MLISTFFNSGEPLEYIQFITIYDDPNDTDGDGIPNDKDNCEFINVWIDERTGVDHCGLPINDEVGEELIRKDHLHANQTENKSQLSVLNRDSPNNDAKNNEEDQTNEINNELSEDSTVENQSEAINIFEIKPNKSVTKTTVISTVVILSVILLSILIYKMIKRKSV